MAAATDDFAAWQAQAEIPQARLTPEVQTLLRAVFDFRQEQGSDYYSTRLLGHFLLHCHSGLKVAQIAPDRPPAHHQPAHRLAATGALLQEAVQQAHHRTDGR